MALAVRTSPLTSTERVAGEDSTRTASCVLLVVGIVGIWANGWAQSLANTMINGRGYVSGLQSTVQFSPLGDLLDTTTLYGSLLALLMALTLSAHRLGRLRIGPLMVVAALWFILVGLHLITGSLPFTAKHFVFLVLLTVTTAVTPDPRILFRLFAVLTVLMAAGSIAFGLASPDAFMSQTWADSSAKGILPGGILAGPYSHSNALGLSLALGLPFVVTQLRGITRFAGLSLTVVGLVWSASRISLISSVAILALAIVVGWARASVARALLTIASFLALAVMVVLPRIVEDPELFTNRGLIWMTSREYGWESWLFGHGNSAYTTVNPLTTRMGFLSTTGHNASITFWVTGGLLGLVVIGGLLFLCLRNARSQYVSAPAALLFIAALLLTCIAEDPIRSFLLGPQTFIIVPMLAYLVIAPETINGRSPSPIDQNVAV